MLFVSLNESFSPVLWNVSLLLHHNLYSSGFASLSENLNKSIQTYLVFSQSLSHCTFLHIEMQHYFPFPPILSCFSRSSTVFSYCMVDSIGLCDNSSDFPLFMKSAVLFDHLGPRVYARKNITS